MTATPKTAASPRNTRNTGPGRLLIAVYAVFAISATARAGYQILTKFSEAPLAYLLSAWTPDTRRLMRRLAALCFEQLLANV